MTRRPAHDPQRAEPPADIPETMAAVVLTGFGGFDRLAYRTDVAVPRPGPHEVLIRVRAAGVNNTDINTRVGWYSKSVSGDTASAAAPGGTGASDDGAWAGGSIEFPRIQGADACGQIVAVGADVDEARIGERVIVSSMQRHPSGDRPFVTTTFGSECDGGFAQYAVAHSAETHAVRCDWSDVELASIPCAYSTAENMLERIGLSAGERVLISGASGGVGSAAVQLAKRRGAEVTALCGAAKADAVAALSADRVLDRDADLASEQGSMDVVVDLVAGAGFKRLLGCLRIGGRYVTAGAIAGPLVELDVRDLYLRDLTLAGATYQAAGVFENLVGYIERAEIRPVVAATYPLADIVAAQRDFLAKGFVGKLVLLPPD